MKIQYMSDLHLEFHPLELLDCGADVLILAGDIHVGDRALSWISKQVSRDIPVLYVLGNHEYYGKSYPDLVEDLKQKGKPHGIHVLERDSFHFKGVNFFGCTLWTDFNLGDDPDVSMQAAQVSMNDFRYIRNTKSNRMLTAQDTYDDFNQSLEWLSAKLKEHDQEKNIVITHHGPSEQSVHPRFSGDVLNAAFVSNLDGFILKREPMHWIHGHTHNRAEYTVGRCAVHANPRGYPSENEAGFELEACILVE